MNTTLIIQGIIFFVLLIIPPVLTGTLAYSILSKFKRVLPGTVVSVVYVVIMTVILLLGTTSFSREFSTPLLDLFPKGSILRVVTFVEVFFGHPLLAFIICFSFGFFYFRKALKYSVKYSMINSVLLYIIIAVTHLITLMIYVALSDPIDGGKGG